MTKMLERINDCRKRLKTTVEKNYVQILFVFLIIVNSIVMGLMTFNFVLDNDDIYHIFEAIDTSLLMVFTVELGINLFAYGIKEFFSDNWFVFDFLCITCSWLLSGITVIRAFRVFRAFRIFAKIDNLRKIISALTSTGEKMFSIVVVLASIFYIFAVMFTSMFGDCYEEGCYEEDNVDYFGRLDYSLFTLFSLMTMEGWIDVVRFTSKKYDWCWFPIIIFIMISAFVLLNLVVAVLCEALATLNAEADMEGCERYDEEEDVAKQPLYPGQEKIEKIMRIVEELHLRLDYIQRQIDSRDDKMSLQSRSTGLSSQDAVAFEVGSTLKEEDEELHDDTDDYTLLSGLNSSGTAMIKSLDDQGILNEVEKDIKEDEDDKDERKPPQNHNFEAKSEICSQEKILEDEIVDYQFLSDMKSVLNSMQETIYEKQSIRNKT